MLHNPAGSDPCRCVVQSLPGDKDLSCRALKKCWDNPRTALAVPPHCDLTRSHLLFQASISIKSLPEPTAAQGEFLLPVSTQPLVITRELTQLVSAFLANQPVHAGSCSSASTEPLVFAFLPWSWGPELKTQLGLTNKACFHALRVVFASGEALSRCSMGEVCVISPLGGLLGV